MSRVCILFDTGWACSGTREFFGESDCFSFVLGMYKTVRAGDRDMGI